jgi:hypothetical protein
MKVMQLAMTGQVILSVAKDLIPKEMLLSRGGISMTPRVHMRKTHGWKSAKGVYLLSSSPQLV